MTHERNGAHRYRVTKDGLVLEVGYSNFVKDHTGRTLGRWSNSFRRATPEDIDPSLLVGVPD